MTKVFGHSDDIICVEGEQFTDELYGGTVVLSDGTALIVAYDEDGDGQWRISLCQTGTLFDRIDRCNPNDPDHPYSDVAYFRDGITFAGPEATEVED